jgi:hypothetical protein
MILLEQPYRKPVVARLVGIAQEFEKVHQYLP